MSNQRKGIHVKKGQSAFEAMQATVPHWIHDTKPDENSVNGVLYLPGCTCSNCGYHANMEKKICPHCGSRMGEMAGIRSE